MKNERRTIKTFSIILSLLLIIAFSWTDAAYAGSDSSYYGKIKADESKWLASLQLDNGAIPETSYKNIDVDKEALKVTPYFSDFAAQALLESGDKYTARVKAYMDWHFSHLNDEKTDINGQTGTIYDYYEHVDQEGNVTEENVTEGEVRKASYDSTDSYGATFLSLLWKYYKVTGDGEYIKAHKTDIDNICKAMLCTMNKGLTMARPDYETKYLMDNAEVYSGSRDGVRLYKALFADDEMTVTLAKANTTIKKNIESRLWNKKGGYYYPAVEKNGKPSGKFKWNRFYMDATAQVFPVNNGVISPKSKRAVTLYKTFNKHWSTSKYKNHRWEKLKYPDTYYWGDLVYAAALMKDRARARTYMATYMKKVKASGHAYPLTCGDCGKVIMAASILE